MRAADGSGFAVMDYGAAIVTLDVPDRDGRMADVVTGFDSVEAYAGHGAFFGAIVGRYANRIAGARFALDGEEYRLSANDDAHSLHGGADGFYRRCWTGTPAGSALGSGVAFTLVSEDGDQGYPGEVAVTATYLWTEDHRLVIDYAASADRATPFSISHHSYWNLHGRTEPETVLDHILLIHADSYLPVDEAMIPVEGIAPVHGTPFDFHDPKRIGRDIDGDHEQLFRAGGYDHNWILSGSGMREVAMLSDPASGRSMTILTDQPGLQCYTGNFLDGKTPGKGGKPYLRRSAVALETQHFPDSPNRPDFPDTILRPGRDFASRTIYAFSAE